MHSRALAIKAKIPEMILPESPEGSGAPVGFINLGSLTDRLPNKRLGPSRQHATHEPAQESKTIGRKGGPVTDRKVCPKRNSARSSTTLAHFSDRSARFGL